MISGSAIDPPSCSEIVATTMKSPSAESMRRSRSASVGDVTDVDPVDEDHARVLALAEARATGVELQHIPVLGLEDPVGVDPDSFGEQAVQAWRWTSPCTGST